MSGSSLDGLDIAFVQLTEVRGDWSFELLNSDCVPYNDDWLQRLMNATSLNGYDLMLLHTDYGRYLGEQVKAFVQRNALEHSVYFIASHGHTVFHAPEKRMTFQLGEGAALAAAAGYPVINDLRTADVALGGQGAPIVPIGDRLLFKENDCWLNLGGIANVTIKKEESFVAFDVCPCNQVLNALIRPEGKAFDEDGKLASGGNVIPALLEQLDRLGYYHKQAPKSLANTFSVEEVMPIFNQYEASIPDKLCTAVAHIATQISKSISGAKNNAGQLLVTGGGALNGFMMEKISKALSAQNIQTAIPERKVIEFKEAIAMALIGTLRWREEENVMASVTGASANSINGAIWLPSV